MWRLAWHTFKFDIPDEWEVTRYSIAEPVGRFEFSTRDGSMGRLSWERTKRFPDEERMLTEYHRRYLQRFDEDEVKDFSGIKTQRIGEFLVGYRNTGEPCQAVAHLEDERVVLMWVFPEYKASRMKKVWKPMLESFKPNRGKLQEWAAFGLRCRLPVGFDIERCTCNPADTWIEFQHRNMHRIDFHRWGLPRELLYGRSLEEFAREILRGSGVRVLTCEPKPWRGMESLFMTTESKGTKGMDKLFSSMWRGEARVWHDTKEKRIYAYIQAGPKKVKLLADEEMIPA
jgi:hypothetical protein